MLKTNKCELCSREVNDGARLCGPCAEMVQRVADVSQANQQPSEQVEETGELLKKKRDRAQAKAEALTPIILGDERVVWPRRLMRTAPVPKQWH